VLRAGPAKKVTIYVGEDRQYHGRSVYGAILDYLFFRGVSGANVVRGIAGFGADHLHTTRILNVTENLPIRIEFIESADKVEELLAKLQEMAGTGLIEIQDTTVAKASETSQAHAREETAPALKQAGNARLMRIYVGENDKWRDRPLYQALVESMRANDIAGVTVLQGILGYGANRRIHKDKLLSLSHDRPILLSVVDAEEKLRAILPMLEEMIQQGLVVLSDVEVIQYTPDRQAGSAREPRR
jgi:PII-like signaling protein